VKRQYLAHRRALGIPERCDISACTFHTTEPIWMGKRLPLVLDHVKGVKKDNRPDNLRLLCPNCDSQLHTRGGGNKGRIRNVSETGFIIQSRDGRVSQTIIPPTGRLTVGGQSPNTLLERTRER